MRWNQTVWAVVLGAVSITSASLSCSSAIPTQGSLDVRTVGDGAGLVAITRTAYGSCDGGASSCETQTSCSGGGNGYLCGVGYEADHPVVVHAYPDRGSRFGGWSAVVTPPSGSPTALPDDPAPSKDLTQSSPAKIDLTARFSKLDAGTD